MKLPIVALVVTLSTAMVPHIGAAPVSSFDDIEVWAGEGKTAQNRAALVIQWNVNTTPPGATLYTFLSYSFAWGYGWSNGTMPTGRDMLLAVDAAETRLAIDYHPSQNTVFGAFLDLDGDGGSYTSGVPGVTGVSDTAGSVTDSDDLYVSGWANGFWSYRIRGGNFDYVDFSGVTRTFSSPGSSLYADATAPWRSSPVGDLSRPLIDGSWDSFNFRLLGLPAGVSNPSLQQPLSAVPEPSTWMLALLSLGVLVYALRKRRV